MAEPNDDIDALYGLPLDAFVAARDRLAKEIRDRGDRDAAARVKKARRPSVPAWAVNQLIRNHRSEVEDLLSLREELRAAASGNADRQRAVVERRRRLVNRLLERAEEVLTEAGHAAGRSTMDRIEDTLTAATMDQEAADAVRAGRLERELARPSGFEALGERVVETAPRRDQRTRERDRRAEQRAREAEDAAQEADREARRLEQEAERAGRAAERARREADRAAERARELREKAEPAPPGT